MENYLKTSGTARGEVGSYQQQNSSLSLFGFVVRTFQQLLKTVGTVSPFSYALQSTCPRIHRSNNNLI